MTTPVPAGWYPDQTAPGYQRWWDGVQWTEHVQDPYDPAAAATALMASEGTKTGTVWVWLIVLLPLSSIASIFLIDIEGYIRSMTVNSTSSTAAELSLITSPGYVANLVFSFLLYGLSVFFAALDARVLAQRGVQRPFHWAFTFLGGIVYVIGRSVVVRHRTGQGLAPLWGFIAVQVVIFIASFVWAIVLVQSLMNSMPGYYSIN
ncbi:MAG TPA: DUF2510 domain-containing protein [Pseudolysinimonas sp.]|nr:DUF2510 domain-containing protein [Pseudolysinimonas sp.]